MPVFAHLAAHAVIDTFALLLWHQIFFSRLCQESLQLPHLKALIDYYLRQCQPSPLPIRIERYLTMPVISVQNTAEYDTLA